MVGERELVKKITGKLFAKSNVLVRAGEDDGAVVKIGRKKLVFTTDIGFRATHFPGRMSFREIGFKTVAVNLSDLAAMGAKPECVLASVGITKKMKESEVEELARGMNEACKKYNASFVGGDTKKAKELTVSVCTVGEMVEGGKVLSRNNARAGDLVCVTGEIGNAVCGLNILLSHEKTRTTNARTKNSNEQNKNQTAKLVRSFVNPTPRIREALVLSEFCSRVAAIDCSDGLLFTAREIAEASRVRIEIDRKKIPVSKEAGEYARRNGLSESDLLDAGEDYELVACLSEKDFERARENGVKLFVIGRVESGSGLLVDGKKVESKGYDAFLAENREVECIRSFENKMRKGTVRLHGEKELRRLFK